FTRARKDGHWFCFRARVVDPAARSTDPPEFAALAERFGFADAAAAVAAVQVVRRRFDMLLREVISETIASPDDLEDELRWFASVLRVG
ncbi:MAG: hypothetical protein JNJ48_03200, partial [Phycisphaerae bacterium]|nr:hypothetical protein [Phycisphaerae bacterium]